MQLSNPTEIPAQSKTFGDIGTYAFIYHNVDGVDILPGDEITGNGVDSYWFSDLPDGPAYRNHQVVPNGQVWRAMAPSENNKATLFIRIS